MASGYVNLPITGAAGLTASELPSNIPATKIGNGLVDDTAYQSLAGMTGNIATSMALKQGLLSAVVPISISQVTVAGGIVAPLLGASVTGTTLVVDVTGNVRPLLSTREAKENIRPLAVDPAVLLNLNTYSYNYIGSDATEDVTHGFLAEEVAEVAPDLVIFKDGKPYSLQHVEFLAPMLELIKQHEMEIAELKLAQVQAAPVAICCAPTTLPTMTFFQRLKWLFTGRI